MAAKTTRSKARTSTSSTKRANSRSNKQSKSLLGKSFDLSSNKVRFFITVLIIAIIGGGYFTFRSFADTQLPNIYKMCTANDCLNGNPLGKGASVGYDSQKNNMKYYKLTKGGYASIDVANPPKGAQVQYCMTARADNKVFVTPNIGYNGKGGSIGNTIIEQKPGWAGTPGMYITTSWADICSSTEESWAKVGPNVGFSLTNDTNTPIYIAKMFLRSNVKPPAATPAPSKN